MIHEVDDALRQLLRTEVLRSGDVDIVLEAPTKDWAARRNAPTVNLYLYDIREDMRRRSRGRLNEYDEQGQITARHLPPRYIKLSYLVTAWTQRPEDEHRLLSALLMSLLAHDAMPVEMLTGSLLEMGLPVPITVALPPPEDRAFADVWSALGGELKPSLDVVVSAPVDSGRRTEAATIASEGVLVSMNGDDPVRHARAPELPQSGQPAEESRVAMVRMRREPGAR
ncbi:DUF4255 domain-containing protein [Actinoplanes sp. NBRC 103695]|uniref:DUF4255 domain-containing protein n=1 Tax=Actinoplanes sp. NBRC 103695 TaxID=3032202 RepID=UPI0024A0B168|nr:DUF4255 domain-containing protein [Actinoplanes sp. NBRC 103695]GLY94496.1 hypothetical protein Acsp02_17520 [Actinoplanes sp. NBRC 103695]